VKGDIHTPSLQIDKGVIFEGRSFMEGASKPSQPQPAPVQPKPAAPTPVK
jgi:cytoskeletal protein CcmA (bactofilin family)